MPAAVPCIHSCDGVVISSHRRLHLRVSYKGLVPRRLLVSNSLHAADTLPTPTNERGSEPRNRRTAFGIFGKTTKKKILL